MRTKCKAWLSILISGDNETRAIMFLPIGCDIAIIASLLLLNLLELLEFGWSNGLGHDVSEESYKCVLNASIIL